MGRYAVVDLETTGFSPAHHHRVLEIAVVIVDDEGCSVHEWDTLINPQRDVGPTEVHGLTGADVYAAPTFSEVASEFAELLRGRVPVAHNLSFDAAFVAAEFDRAGYPVSIERTAGLCTMRLARHYLPTGSRTLEACCDCIGCKTATAHAALQDARAAARLLNYYIRHDADFLNYWADAISEAQRIPWPTIPVAPERRLPRQSAAATAHGHFLGRLTSRLPRSEVHPEANSYLTLLDRVLLDRQISRHEEDELVAAAEMMSLSREEANQLHLLYIKALATIACEDGVVTAEEHNDLTAVAVLLGLDEGEVESALRRAMSSEERVCRVGCFALKPGDAVVFTGEAPGIDRIDLEYQARSLGLRPTRTVSGKTTIVVAADPDSMSGKARKARDLGVPIVDYRTYLGLLDSNF